MLPEIEPERYFRSKRGKHLFQLPVKPFGKLTDSLQFTTQKHLICFLIYKAFFLCKTHTQYVNDN